MPSLDKPSRIKEAAISLFNEKGVQATSVNDIVAKAHIAKGTFYLYYPNKTTLVSQILIQFYGELLNELMKEAYLKDDSISDVRILFINRLIHYYRTHPKVLELLQKNVASIFSSAQNADHIFSYVEHFDDYIKSFQKTNQTLAQAKIRFVMMLETIGIICFHAIVYQQPAKIEVVEKELLSMVYAMYL